MFTGIITNTTTIVGQQKTTSGLELVFARPSEWADLALGESIATDGVCLTVAALDAKTYTCTLIPETLAVTTFGKAIPQRVNLERALRLGDRLSGHMVQGHVDCVGKVTGVDTTAGYKLTFSLPKEQVKYVSQKGSITVNGVSLTVMLFTGDSCTVALVPHTLEHTTLGDIKNGDLINIELDVLAKHVAQLMKENL